MATFGSSFIWSSFDLACRCWVPYAEATSTVLGVGNHTIFVKAGRPIGCHKQARPAVCNFKLIPLHEQYSHVDKDIFDRSITTSTHKAQETERGIFEYSNMLETLETAHAAASVPHQLFKSR